MATLIWFLGPFTWNILPFTLRLCLSLMLRYVSWMQQKGGSCFHVQSISLYLFIGETRPPLLLRIFSEQCLLICIILLFVVVWIFSLLLMISCCEIIYYLCFLGCG